MEWPFINYIPALPTLNRKKFNSKIFTSFCLLLAVCVTHVATIKDVYIHVGVAGLIRTNCADSNILAAKSAVSVCSSHYLA
jgi:hypothetical protein